VQSSTQARLSVLNDCTARSLRLTQDLLSCLPIQYVGLIITCSGGECQSKGSQSKSVKILRLLRLGKLLRLARLKRLLKKWEDTFDLTPYLGTFVSRRRAVASQPGQSRTRTI
jgi:hypothetical protein